MFAKTEICLEDVKFRRIFCNNFDPNLSIDLLCSCCTIHGPIAKQTPLFVLGVVNSVFRAL